MVKTKSFGEVLADGPVFIPGIYDALSARFMETNEFSAMYLPSDCVAASLCGVPDASLISSADLVDVVQRITALSTVSLIVDVDAGFGSEINVIRTCERISACGARAICLSDKIYLREPLGMEVQPADSYYSKLDAAIYALQDQECVVIAKIDAYAALGLDEAIKRANHAIQHGAAAACITGVSKREDLKRICAGVKGACIYEMVSDGKVMFDFDELTGMGFCAVWAPYVSMSGAMTCIKELADAAMESKNDFRAEERGYSTYAKFELLKIHEWYALGKKFNSEVQDAVDINPDDYLKKQQEAES